LILFNNRKLNIVFFKDKIVKKIQKNQKENFKIQIIIKMAWYGSHVDATKKLDQLIDQSPSLQQLLNYPDFIQQLKAYNPKLLDFLTNSPIIIT